MIARNIFLTNTMSLYFAKQTLNRCEIFCRRQTHSLFFRDYANIEIRANFFSVQSKIFAKQPLDPIPGYCIPNPFGYSDAKA